MPPRKTTPKITPRPAHAPHAPYAPLFMVVIVALLTIGLLLIWRELPMGPQPKPPAPVTDVKPVPATPASAEQTACEAARGKWVECGNPCHGKPGEVCITSCEPQCLCGGIAGWMCPKDQACTDYEPSATTPDALGVCRSRALVPIPSEPIRERPSGMICDDLNFICVDAAVEETSYEQNVLFNPFLIQGTGIAFENTINWRLVDGDGAVLGSGFMTADAPDVGQPGAFETRAFILAKPRTATGTLEVFEYSAKDGTPIHVAKVTVHLPTAMMKTKFYMPSGSTTDCSETVPVEFEVPRSSLPVETALRTLLAVGPTMSSRRTAIPVGTRLESIKVSNGTATVVFSPELQNYGGGSCNVAAIRAQIEQTLKQFSTVKNVVISTVGKTPEETLQP
ncbi:GerMN domain-containing protein [Candidatus Uhrbacteria bacterium]|nr:GerMN domain-containing protein [Candidatus Uhrbacteria bacterium]